MIHSTDNDNGSCGPGWDQRRGLEIQSQCPLQKRGLFKHWAKRPPSQFLLSEEGNWTTKIKLTYPVPWTCKDPEEGSLPRRSGPVGYMSTESWHYTGFPKLNCLLFTRISVPSSVLATMGSKITYILKYSKINSLQYPSAHLFIVIWENFHFFIIAVVRGVIKSFVGWKISSRPTKHVAVRIRRTWPLPLVCILRSTYQHKKSRGNRSYSDCCHLCIDNQFTHTLRKIPIWEMKEHKQKKYANVGTEIALKWQFLVTQNER